MQKDAGLLMATILPVAPSGAFGGEAGAAPLRAHVAPGRKRFRAGGRDET
jgi:hypothetical protein